MIIASLGHMRVSSHSVLQLRLCLARTCPWLVPTRELIPTSSCQRDLTCRIGNLTMHVGVQSLETLELVVGFLQAILTLSVA